MKARKLLLYGALLLSAAVLAPAQSSLQITTSIIDPIALGQPYFFAMHASGGSGTLTWSSTGLGTGNLVGLSIDPSTGVISGTPSLTGVSFASGTFTVSVKDSVKSVSVTLFYRLNHPMVIVINGGGPAPPAHLGLRYCNVDLIADGAYSFPVSYALLSGSMPPGITLSQGGDICGYPKALGTYDFVVRGTDSSVTPYDADLAIRIIVDNAVQITSTDMPMAAAGQDYREYIQIANGVPPYHFSQSSVQTSWTGIFTLDPNTGLVTGRANTPGATFYSEITVTDSASPPTQDTKMVNVRVCYPLFLVVPGIGDTFNLVGYLGIQMNSSFGTGAGCGDPKIFISDGILPPGISMVGNSIQGVPTARGEFHARVKAIDRRGQSDEKELYLQVHGGELLTNDLPSGTLGVPYRFVLDRDSTGTTTLFAGALPPGLTLESLALIDGTPTQAGTYSFTVAFDDGLTAPLIDSTHPYTLTIKNQGTTPRNDSRTNATPIENGTYSATLSPYANGPNLSPAPDIDFYKISSFGQEDIRINLETDSPVAPVLQLEDGNGIIFSTCMVPAYSDPFTGDPFYNPNDNVNLCRDGATYENGRASLQFHTPWGAGEKNDFFVHVQDYNGNARPEYQYSLIVTGVPSGDPKIRFSVPSFDFGPQVAGSDMSRTVVVQNSGAAPLVINSISFSGSPWRFNHNCPSVLPHGEYCDIQLGLLAQSVGTFSGTLTIDHNDPSAPKTYSVVSHSMDFQISLSRPPRPARSQSSQAMQFHLALQASGISASQLQWSCEGLPAGASCSINVGREQNRYASVDVVVDFTRRRSLRLRPGAFTELTPGIYPFNIVVSTGSIVRRLPLQLQIQ